MSKRGTGRRGVNVRTATSRKSATQSAPRARWIKDGARQLVVIENRHCRIALWPAMGGAIVSYVDQATGIDIIWRNPQVTPARPTVLDQPMQAGSDLYDVMDGSWYVSLPNGFFAGDYFGAPLGTHGELRCVPWEVTSLKADRSGVSVTLCGRSVRTPLVYHRELRLTRDGRMMRWRETLENRWDEALPVAWLQHPTFGGPLLDGARLVTPARTVRVWQADDPAALQLQSGYVGSWPQVPERDGGRMRDCSVVPAAGSGGDHSVQLTDFVAGQGCIWNEARQLGFALEWDLATFPYAWSWNCSGGVRRYPLWGQGHIITLQPSTSPVGRFAELVRTGQLMTVAAGGKVSTVMWTGFVDRAEGPWSEGERS